MTLRQVLPAIALVVAAVAATLALVLGADGVEQGAKQSEEGPEVAVDVRLLPRSVDFGDTLTAQVDVTVDRRRVDPASVRIQQEFTPWGLVKPVERSRHDSDDTTFLRTTYVMRCVIGPCVPPRETYQLEFDPARVTYRHLEGDTRDAVEAQWPVLVTRSNVIASDLERREAVTTPWRADLVSLPEPTYAASPTLLRWLLFGAALVLGLAGIALAVRVVPRREVMPEPEPEPEPEPALPPLELALILLTEEVRQNGAADRRRALELVAEEMEARHELPLARRARAMAWSEETPTLAETSGLAASVRQQLALFELEDEPADDGEEEAGAPGS